MNDNSQFFERVKNLAKTKSVNLRDLIEKCGINYDSYNSYKRYGNLPRAEEAVAIASALGTTVEYLVTGKTTDNAEVCELLRKALEKLSS